MHLPSKPIQSITIFVKGDPSVGIPSTHFKMETYIDIECYAGDDTDKHDILCEIKQSVRGSYCLMMGEADRVLFDYEIDAREKVGSTDE